MASTRPRLSIIIPFHRGLPLLERALGGVTPLAPGDELIIAADGAVDDCSRLAAAHGARVVEIEGPRGPAVARNVAASVALGDVFVFVDADVVATLSAVEGAATLFAERPDIAAVFGAYDDEPGAKGFVSEYKNLAHAYIHRVSSEKAKTFWAGFGAIRREAFEAVGGFDERFERPSIEDIDLGYRVTGAGYRIKLDPSLAVCHLKRWTFRSMISSDIFDRGIPWTQLIHRYQQFDSDLNVQHTMRLSVAASYLAVLFLLLGVVHPAFILGAIAPLALVAYWGRDYYAFFRRRRGLWFALGVFPLHCLTHLYNGVSFGVGTILYMLARLDIRLPGALPATAPAPPRRTALAATASGIPTSASR